MTELSLLIRTEQPIDSEAIERLHERAFGPGRFARTASRLREGAPHLLDLSFTALVGTLLVGSVRMTPVKAGDVPALMLGPLTVEPAFESRGIGAALMRRSLDAAKAKGHTVELVGTETLAGGPAHRLKVRLASGPIRDVWLDAASALVVKTVSTRVGRGRDVELETVYGDYQETGGARFPRSLETGVRGRPRRLRIVVESVETNPVLGDDRFRMPR